MLPIYVIATTKDYFANPSGNRRVVERRNVESSETARGPSDPNMSSFVLNNGGGEERSDPCSDQFKAFPTPSDNIQFVSL